VYPIRITQLCLLCPDTGMPLDSSILSSAKAFRKLKACDGVLGNKADSVKVQSTDRVKGQSLNFTLQSRQVGTSMVPHSKQLIDS